MATTENPRSAVTLGDPARLLEDRRGLDLDE
jgi:hypothetical protein